jgi:hypothetical protein
MPESNAHSTLVQSLVGWIAEERCDGDRAAILLDSLDVPAWHRPPRVGGFVPDAYANAQVGETVGEAKTHRDLENRHSVNQMEAFLQYCGRRDGSLFVLAVPWHRVAYARNLLGRICRRTGIDATSFQVLADLPG